MPIGTTAALIGLAIGAGGSVASSAIGSHSASKAADAQVDASKYAADISRQNNKDTLALEEKLYNDQSQFTKDVYADQVKALQPYLDQGKISLADLANLINSPEASEKLDLSGLPGPFNFQQDPGYQFRMDEGEKAIQRLAVARGSGISGSTIKAATEYAQNYASDEYSKAYARYSTDYDRALGTATTKFNADRSVLSDKANRLAALAGIGQTSTGQVNAAGSSTAGLLAQLGTNYSSNASSTMTNSANLLAELALQGGNARASGYVGSANAWSGLPSTIVNGAVSGFSLLDLLNKGGAGKSTGGIYDSSGFYIGE